MEIKEEYNKMFSTSLASDIGQNFNGNLSSLLLALIKGGVWTNVCFANTLSNAVNSVSTVTILFIFLPFCEVCFDMTV